MGEVERVATVVIIMGWVCWAGLWVALSGWVKPDARREPPWERALHTGPLVLAVLLMTGHLIPLAALSQPILPRAPWMSAAGAAMVAAGLGLAVWARLVLARNWSGVVTVKQDHELVRSGPYRMVRHPIYTGLLLAIAGNMVAIDAWRGVLALAIVTAAFLRKMRTEETFMTETFGAAYATYRAKTAALIPGVA